MAVYEISKEARQGRTRWVIERVREDDFGNPVAVVFIAHKGTRRAALVTARLLAGHTDQVVLTKDRRPR